MKKILLIVLFALSLYANEVQCQSYVDLSQKYAKLVSRAMVRHDEFDTKIKSEMAIMYLDRALVECAEEWGGREAAKNLRDSLMMLIGLNSEAI